MTGEDLLTSLDLPIGSLVQRRVPKKLLLENGAHTAADRRRITEGIEVMHWHAALKPATIGVSEYRDAVREYLEIAVVRMTLRPGAKAERLVELVHRSVPYPLLLVAESGGRAGLSAVHIRRAQNEAGRTVLDGEVTAVGYGDTSDASLGPSFRTALALGRQPHGTLYALYQGWIDTLLALRAARVTGVFNMAGGREQAARRQVGLQEYSQLAAEVLRLRAAAAKEKQVPRRVELNLLVKKLEAALAAARAKL